VRRAVDAFRALAARPALHGAALLVLAVAIVFAHLGETHLANFDDCYYGQKAKEMVQGGDWATPHFGGLRKSSCQTYAGASQKCRIVHQGREERKRPFVFGCPFT